MPGILRRRASGHVGKVKVVDKAAFAKLAADEAEADLC